MVTLQLFGNPQLKKEEGVVRVGTRKGIALAAYLVVTGESQSRDTLVALLWPELDQKRGRAALRSTLSALKKGLGDIGLLVDGEQVGWDDTAVSCDVTQFKDQMVTVQSHDEKTLCADCVAALQTAVSLYRDDFLLGFGLSDSIPFDDWQFMETEQLREQFVFALRRLIGGLEAQSKFEEAVGLARRWLALDPLLEEAHQAVMRLYGGMEQQTAVQRQYDRCVTILAEELGVEPSAETVAVYEAAMKINKENEDGRLTSRKPKQSLVSSFQSLTPLVGRVNELDQIDARLADDGCRLLTLVGGGGMGKTRLALETAVRHQARFVPLAAVVDESHLVGAIAGALGFSFYGTQPPKVQLLDFLREKSFLMVLDNFEHLVDGATLLTTILQHAAGVKILATSRERLRVHGEWIVEIGGLPVEYGNGTAVQFFIQTAQRIYPDFPVNDHLADIERICQMVEGMPLAIELAAAWVRTLDCAEIAEEIAHNLDFLETNLRDLPERHRSLRAVFDHSWALLDEREREGFRRLSIFRGGFDRRAATAVTQTRLPTLSALVDNSLLRREGNGRYQVPEALRQFAAEKRRPIEPELNREHARYFADFLQAQEAGLKGGGQQKATLDGISAEIENVRQAWHWAVENGDETAVKRGMESLFLYYEMRSLFEEGVAAFRGTGDWRLEIRRGRFLHRLGRYQEAQPVVEKSLAEARSAKDTGEMALALLNLGYVSWSMSSYDEAQQYFEESLMLYRQSGAKFGALRVLNGMAITPQNLPRMRELLEESLAIAQEIGDLWGVARALNNLGMVSRDVVETQRLSEEAIAICREIDDRYLMTFPLINLGHTVRMQGDFVRARALYEESLATCREIGFRPGAARCYSHLGTVAAALGEYETAVAYCLDGIPLCQTLGDQRGLGLLYYTQGFVLLDGEITESRGSLSAGDCFGRSLEIFRETADRQGEAWPLLGLARLAFFNGDILLAKQRAEEAVIIFEQVGDKHGLARVALLLGQMGNGERMKAGLETAVSLQAPPLIHQALVTVATTGQPVLGLALARFVGEQTAVTDVVRRWADGLVESWENNGMETAVKFTQLEQAIKAAQ